jgi:hypothetical protein
MWRVSADNFGHHQAILKKYRITGYFWYVDDTKKVYSLTHAVTKKFGKNLIMFPQNLEFTMGQEQILDNNYT